MIASLIMSFTDYAIVNDVKFIGFQNYKELFDGTDPFFYKSLKVTTYFVFLSVPINIILAFLVALVMNQPIKGKALILQPWSHIGVADLVKPRGRHAAKDECRQNHLGDPQ